MNNQIRLTAFNWIKDQAELYDDVIPRKVLEKGFEYYGQTIHVIGPQGIFKPQQLELPLTITTSCNSSYSDRYDKNGLLLYSYRGTDPNHPDNRGLRELMRNKIPLIYFLCITPGKYMATWPVYIVGDEPVKLRFTVAVDDVQAVKKLSSYEQDDPELGATTEAKRIYLTGQVKIRAHQKTFRERVLRAYQNQCTLCRLKHPELLDAAHIIPDNEEEGLPLVTNGLSLCKIHHAAFDKNIIGISADYEVHVREDILAEIDGPMLKFGLQSLNKQKIILPSRKAERPDRDRLAIRFDRFNRAI